MQVPHLLVRPLDSVLMPPVVGTHFWEINKRVSGSELDPWDRQTGLVGMDLRKYHLMAVFTL